MELTFVHQYGDSVPKRRRLAKACESCRARKKRCVHFAGNNAAKDNGLEKENDSSLANEDSYHRPDESTTPSKKFLSDLIPTTTFIERPKSGDDSEKRQPNEDIGVWVDKRDWEALTKARHEDDAGPNSAHVHSGNHRPHSAVLGPLIDIYFEKVHPILPLLDEAEFRKNHAGGIVPEPLALALCLVAAKDPKAEPHLRLTEEASAPLPPREFCSRLYTAVVGALRVPVRFEKITLIRILALTSLHAEGQDGSEEASMFLTQAMHYTQTLGWHLGQQAGAVSGDDLTTKRIFWCLWSLDRINSAIYGRPIMMSDIDIAIEPFEPGESGFPGFEAWLKIAGALNQVIGFYRPGNSPSVSGWEDDFTNFEQLMDESLAWTIPQSVQATLHLFYLLVAVLSHRSRGVKYVPRGSASYVRQSLCTIEIVRLMDSHLFQSLHPFPILPYAISLALSVCYQRIRQAQLQHQQEDALQDFSTCCSVIQKLRRTWSSVDIIATIAKKVLDELKRAPDLASFRVARNNEQRRSPVICTASLADPKTLIDDELSNGHDQQVGKEPGGSEGEHQNGATMAHDGFGLLEGMDDIFGTYLDPNYPVNLDDFSFMDDVTSLDWNPA